MKVEEQIKQAADRYARSTIIQDNGNDHNYLSVDFLMQFFIDGANFGRELGMKEALEWIPVDKKLPKTLTDVLIKLSNGKIAIGCIYPDEEWGSSPYIKGGKVTHWRAINQEDML